MRIKDVTGRKGRTNALANFVGFSLSSAASSRRTIRLPPRRLARVLVRVRMPRVAATDSRLFAVMELRGAEKYETTELRAGS